MNGAKEHSEDPEVIGYGPGGNLGSCVVFFWFH